jgi:hypothetical protein
MANGLFNLPPIIKDEKQLDQLPDWMLEDLRRTYDPQSNLSNPAYSQGVTGLRAYNSDSDTRAGGALGYVDPFNNPTVVNLSAPFLNDAAQVFAHEAAHVQKGIAEKQVYYDSKKDTLAQSSQRTRRGEEGATLRNQLETNFNNYVKTLDEWKQTPSNVGAYGYGGKPQSWEERFADLQSLESQLPRGTSLLDTPLGQQVFNTPELKRYWMQTTLPLQAKALEQNPELEKNFFDKLEIFRKTFKDEAKTKSFANSAFSALKKAYSANDKVVNPAYQDPFPSTIGNYK